MTAHPTIRFVHWQRVRNLGFNGPRGRIVKCPDEQRPGKHCWRFKPDGGGRWMRPENVVADTEGTLTFRCEHCHIPFRTNDHRQRRCPQCDPAHAAVPRPGLEAVS